MATAAQQEQVRRNNLWISAIAVVALLIVVAIFTSMHHPDTPLHAERATRGAVIASISTNGKIEAADNFEAHAAAPATVKKVLAKEGDAVKAGQLLLQLDDAQARAQRPAPKRRSRPLTPCCTRCSPAGRRKKFWPRSPI
jgi:Membrane-fusion protein